MREILYRGKRTDNGEWVYGYLVKGKFHGKSAWFITPEQDMGGECVCISVKAETVGVYIGHTDKNGDKIFEGDILKGKWNTEFRIYWDNEFAQFCAVERKGSVSLHGIGDYIPLEESEVIGDIYTAPAFGG